MDRLLSENSVDAKQLSPLTLAFIGDTVYDLLVRESIVCDANRPVNDLHTQAVKSVKASAQSLAVKQIMPHLSEDELSVFKRGRNAKPGSVPKNANVGDYHKATGFEALVGYLYLKGEFDRLFAILSVIPEVYNG